MFHSQALPVLQLLPEFVGVGSSGQALWPWGGRSLKQARQAAFELDPQDCALLDKSQFVQEITDGLFQLKLIGARQLGTGIFTSESCLGSVVTCFLA